MTQFNKATDGAWKPVAEELGRRIVHQREENGIEQKELAKALGVARGTIYKYECGSHLPCLINLLNLANAFHVTTDYLLGREA